MRKLLRWLYNTLPIPGPKVISPEEGKKRVKKLEARVEAERKRRG